MAWWKRAWLRAEHYPCDLFFIAGQTLGLPTIKGRSARLRAFAADLLARFELRPRSAWIIAALIGAALGRHFWIDEGYLPNILFTAAVTLALIALVLLITRRALFATVLIA